MRSIALFLFLFVLFSCKQEGHKATLNEDSVVESDTIINLIEEAQPEIKEETLEKQDWELGPLSMHYLMLTEMEGEEVIFNPCDASNGEVRIDLKEGVLQIFLIEGHEVTPFTVKAIHKSETRIDFDVEVYDKFYEKGLFVKGLTADFGRTAWGAAAFGGVTERIYIKNENKSDYKVIDQPCRECWGEQECE